MNSTLINEKNQTQEEIEVMGRATELLKGCDSESPADARRNLPQNAVASCSWA